MTFYKRISPITNVPTNIITGFLGVGKTTAILNLLKNKPENQRWAVLVNEFGEVGVDGALIAGSTNNDGEIVVREVPGGCMCCTSGILTKTALNELLIKSKPDHLLIEPTGLGHPEEIMSMLKNDSYRGVLSVQNVITLVDARKLSDSRYTKHATFNQQIGIADVVIGNKSDLYEDGHRERLEAYVQDKGVKTKKPKQLVFAENGKFDPTLLYKQVLVAQPHQGKFPLDFAGKSSYEETELPSSGMLVSQSNREGMETIGWRFSAKHVFNRKKLVDLISEIKVERLKAVVITSEGMVGFNVNEGVVKELVLQDLEESRIEIISPKINQLWQQQLMQCLQS